MKILSIGTDRSILNPVSESAKRQIAYGAHFDELNIVVLSRGAQPPVVLSTGVRAYSTSSRSRLLYGIDAFRIVWKLPKPDIVTVQDPFETGLFGWLIARLRGAKLHVQVHTDLFAPAFRFSSLNRLRYLVARFVLPRADRIRVNSNRIKEGIEKNQMSRAAISVLPIYTDIAKFKSAHAGPVRGQLQATAEHKVHASNGAGILAGRFSKFKTRLLVVARLEKEKNVLLAIDSFAKVAPLDTCLIIVGDGRERRALEKRAAHLGLSGRIFFEGKTDPLPYYAVADLLLVPSLYEGYGNVIIEALAAGKPVLATDVGIALDAGAYVTEPEHFADALKEWLEKGDRVGVLKQYPYQSFDEYVQAYTDDIKKTARL